MNISLGLSNFYGEVVAKEKDGKYFLELDDYSGTSNVEISQELFEWIKKEFNE